jgi:hypothetical protein
MDDRKIREEIARVADYLAYTISVTGRRGHDPFSAGWMRDDCEQAIRDLDVLAPVIADHTASKAEEDRAFAAECDAFTDAEASRIRPKIGDGTNGEPPRELIAGNAPIDAFADGRMSVATGPKRADSLRSGATALSGVRALASRLAATGPTSGTR